MLLSHDVLETPSSEPKRGLVFAHGILGSRNNWRSFARRVLDQDPRWRAVLVDLRNHGESHGLPGPHTLEACAADVAAVMDACGLEQSVVIGHSFGGKVMLELARQGYRGLEAAWVLDAPPGPRTLETGMEEIGRVIAEVRAVPLPLATRKALLDRLTSRGLSERLAQWMTTNLRPAPDGGGLVWKFDLDAIPDMLASFAARDYGPFLAAHRGPPTIHVVRGGKSDRWSRADLARLDDAPELVQHLMPEAGHWLHTDDPEALLGMLLPTL